eukprot:TRINITY_DN2496_c0_g1_i8.p1 TRINITY_DN2496_c0_g1~~TRINITY_DN2496_c0_g1_i8.p1  ORF type:complete len:185 (-),score=20.55 TRINITY_DN2496_c0_g1_i8:636-1190(-)
MFHVTFMNQSLIHDGRKNGLKTRTLSKGALRQVHFGDALGTAGTGFAFASWLIFIIEMCLNPFKSSQSFWIFINMMQMISYLPVLNCTLSENLRAFLTQYFGTSKASIPFDSLPNWVPNPLTLLELFKIDPINKNFEETGYTSISFVYNFSSQILTWITVLLLYAGVTLGSKLLPKIKYAYELA